MVARAAGVRIQADGADLVWEAAAPPPAHVIDALRQAKADLLALLTASPDFEERAAIVEHAGGVPREWAEGFARLCTMPAPAHLLPARWQQIVDDAGGFIDRWAGKAAALGWRTVDVFGVHAGRPEARYDCAGVVALIQGREVVAITADSARLRCRDGSLMTYRRHPITDPHTVAIWQLPPTFGDEAWPRPLTHDP